MPMLSNTLSAMLGSCRSIDNDVGPVCKNARFFEETRTVVLLKVYLYSSCPWTAGIGKLLTMQLTEIPPNAGIEPREHWPEIMRFDTVMAYELLGSTVTTDCKLPSTRMAYPTAPLGRTGKYKRTLVMAELATDTT